MTLLERYRGMPLKLRMAATAALGASLGLVIYEIIYAIVWFEPRATVSWTLGFVIGVGRQHALHRALTFGGQATPYWRSLRRAYVMYSGSMLFGAGLDWVLVERLGVHHRLAWLACLASTATISLVFLQRFVFAEQDAAHQVEG
jgi:putative flippase GtrA